MTVRGRPTQRLLCTVLFLELCLPFRLTEAQVLTRCCRDCMAQLSREHLRVYGYPIADTTVLYNACKNTYKCDSLYVSCDQGLYDVTCDGMTWGASSRCKPCEAGTYRDDIVNQDQCVACTTCSGSEVQTVECTVVTNRQCGCRSTTFRSGPGVCTPCTVCRAPSQYMTRSCSLTADSVCGVCPLGYKTNTDNELSCVNCVDGYFKANSGLCTECNANTAGCAGSGPTYIQCTGGTRTCPICNGHIGGASCPAGKGLFSKCAGNSLSNPVCQDCAPGMERPAGTPMIDEYQQCVKCVTGKYKLGTNTADCVSCTNKPANSVYKAWGIAQPASTESCPWCACFYCFCYDFLRDFFRSCRNCNAGYYQSSGLCVACPAGTYQDTAGSTVCKACTVSSVGGASRLNFYYLERGAGVVSIADNCPW